MKKVKQTKLLLLVFSLIITVNLQAQVGINNVNPAATALLDVSSGNKGFLPPRMTGAQRNAIVSPANGLIIYCIDCGGGQLNVYSSSSASWTNMIGGAAAAVTPLAIGDSYGGGKIAYILVPGDPGYIAGQFHGLIASFDITSGSDEWGCMGIPNSGADGTALGTGSQNTMDILAGCTINSIAAARCSNHVVGVFSDWHLPSKDELNKLYLNRAAIGGFSNVEYWSSSESTSAQAWSQHFGTGVQASSSKGTAYRIRPIRSF
jgi:Protein of unknown function (DUF1566)